MSGDPQPSGEPPPTGALEGALTSALGDWDLAAARRLVADACAAGATPLGLFVDAIRPALRAAAGAWPQELREKRESEAVRGLAAIVAGQASGEQPSGAGAGRRAVLVGERVGVAALDAQVIVEMLERDGWMVSAIEPDRRDAGRLVAQLEPAAVVVTGSLADGIALRRIREELPQMRSAPLIVRCLLEPEAEGRPPLLIEVEPEAPEGVALDAVLARLARRFSDAGMPAWGVSMRREEDEVLVVTPSGHLDEDTAARLREVVESRRGSFSSLVLNLRELSGSEQPALGDLLRWVADEGWPEPRVGATKP